MYSISATNLIIIQVKSNLWSTGVIIWYPVLGDRLLEVVREHVDPERRDGGADGARRGRLRAGGGDGAREDLPAVSVDTVRVPALSHALTLRDLDKVLEPGVERHHRVVGDEGPAAVLVVLRHPAVPGLAPVVRLEAHLEDGGGPADGAVAPLSADTGGVALARQVGAGATVVERL